MVSIKAVADKAGVSVTTVSFVLNNKGNISDKTRKRVLQAVDDLSYTRSIQARNLRDQQSRVIGYAWHRDRSGLNAVLDDFLFALLGLTEAEGRNMILFSVDDHSSIDAYKQLVESRRVDAFVLSDTWLNDARFHYLEKANIPFVAFGKSNSPMDLRTHWVDVDGHAGIYDATTHLLEEGHTQIAFIGWPEGSVSGDTRYQGYRDALADHSIESDPRRMTRRVVHDVEEGYKATKDLLEQEEITGIVCVTDVIALGVIRYVAETGKRIAVTGFDDIPIAKFAHPTLTSVRQPIETVSEILMEMLFAQLEDREVQKKNHLVKPELIIRASSTLDW